MRDQIVDAVRAVHADDDVRALLVTGTGDAFCAGMDLGGVDRRQGGGAGLQHAQHGRGAAGRRPGVHPRALGARQADGRGGERHGRRPGRAPRARVRLRARARVDPVHVVVRPLGSRRRRRRRVPAAPARRAPAGEGDGDAGRGRDRPGGRRPRPGVPLRPGRRAARHRGRARGAARRRGRRARSGSRSACSTRRFETDLAHSLDLEASYQSLAATSTDLMEGMAAFQRPARPRLHRALRLCPPDTRAAH